MGGKSFESTIPFNRLALRYLSRLDFLINNHFEAHMDLYLSPDERLKALKLCRDYLDGVWKEVSHDQLTIHRISGGLTNIIYRCALHDHVQTYNHEPREVLLRIYGDSPCDVDVQLEVFNQLAQAKLGPILYSAFDGGRFEEYLPSNALSWSLMTSDDVSAIIARKFAAIHRLDVKSLEKRQDWLVERYKEYSDYIGAKEKNDLNFLPGTLDSTKKIASEMLNVNFKHEIDYLIELFRKSTAPLVFSHNDLNQNNILLLHDRDVYLEDRIILIDFEYSSYNYRTFDIANHLTEWCFDYSGDKYPFFTFSPDRFPSEEKQKRFLAEYISSLSDNSEFEQNNIDDKIEALFIEMQPFLMAANLLWAVWAIKSALTSGINFGYWEMASFKYQLYTKHKADYEENSLDRSSAIDIQIPKM